MNLNGHLTPFRRKSCAALLAAVALVGWFAFLTPATGQAGASTASRDTINRGTDAVHPTAHTSENRTAKRNGERTVDGAPRAETAGTNRQSSAVGPCDHRHRADSAGSGVTARGPPTSPTP